MALGGDGGTCAVVAAVGVIVQRHAILAVVLLRRSGCLRRRRLHWIAGRLHCDKRSGWWAVDEWRVVGREGRAAQRSAAWSSTMDGLQDALAHSVWRDPASRRASSVGKY